MSRLLGSEDAWFNAMHFDEHTWGLEQLDRRSPIIPRSAGGFAEKAVFAYRAVGASQVRSQRHVSRAEGLLRLFSHPLHSRAEPRHDGAFGLGYDSGDRDPISGQCRADRIHANRSIPWRTFANRNGQSPISLAHAYDRPNDVWAWQVKQRRFFVANLPPGESRDFELSSTCMTIAAQQTYQSRSARCLGRIGGGNHRRHGADRRRIGRCSRVPSAWVRSSSNRSRTAGQRYVLADRDQNLAGQNNSATNR